MNDLSANLQAVEKILQQATDLQHREQCLAGLSQLVTAMDRDGTDRDTPIREIPARLGDRWSTLLLLLLSTGNYRHSTLRRLVSALSAEGKISQRMLTLRLRTLERDGLVSRHATDSHPPGMEYQLTALGHSLVRQIEVLANWTREHKAEILAARARFIASAEERAAMQSYDD